MARRPPLIRYYDELGEIWLDVPSKADRSKIGAFHNALDAWSKGDADALRPFRGKGVRDAQGKFYPFITNPQILRKLARMGALFGFEDIYKYSS